MRVITRITVCTLYSSRQTNNDGDLVVDSVYTYGCRMMYVYYVSIQNYEHIVRDQGVLRKHFVANAAGLVVLIITGSKYNQQDD